MSGEGAPLARVIERWDEVVLEWGLTRPERYALLGAVPFGRVDSPASYGAGVAEERMRLLVELAAILSRVVGGVPDVRAWLRRSNRHLNTRTPLEALSESTEWARWLIGAMGVAL